MFQRFEPFFMIVAMVLFFMPLILLFAQQRDYFSWKTMVSPNLWTTKREK